MDHEKDVGVPLLGHLGRSLSNLFTRCATPGQVIVLSIDDITNGLGDDVEYLLDGNKRGGPVAMLKWAKGSKNGGHSSSTGHHSATSAGRVSLADLRRASAKLLRRKDSTSKSKNNPTTVTNDSCAHDTKTGTTASSDGGGSPPPPLVPPRGSSAASCHGITTYGYSGESVISGAATPASVRSSSQKGGVIKQATVRRMSTLRQARSVSPNKDRGQYKRPDSSSSSCTTNSSCSPSTANRRPRRKPVAETGDNGSSLYMQLDKIPVAVQQTAGSSSLSSSAYMSAAAANLKRKALEDISNQAYRNIIHSLQDELAQMSEAEAEAARSASADETRTLAEATLLPMNRMEISRSSAVRNRCKKESTGNDPATKHNAVSPCPSAKHHQQQAIPSKKLDGMVASFTNQPPASNDLHRPRPVRHPPSPTVNISDDNLMDFSSLALACSRNGLPSTPTPSGSACHPFNGTSSPVKKSAPSGPHNSTGQHLHQYSASRSLASHGLSISNATGCQDSSSQNKKTRPNKQVTFQTEARLIGESVTLPVVFESSHENGQTDGTKSIQESGPLEMPGFVNVPCSRRGFCLELVSATDLPEVGKLNESCSSNSDQLTTDEVDHVKRVMSPDGGYDWLQPSYVNLEDTEIAPVLLASSRSADDSSDFWKPRSVASGGRQQQKQQLVEPLQPVYDAPNNTSKSIDVDNPLLLEFPGFRYAMMQLPGNNALMERRSISNGSSGSDTQDSGVAEMAQALSLSRAASASPQLAASRQSLAEDMLLPVQPFVYNTLPRTDNKRSLYYNCWSNQSLLQQQQQSTGTQQQSMPEPSCPSSVYSTTDPHFLSGLASPYFSRRMPEEKSKASSSSSSTLMANIDQQDSSWSSDHLYCNMASVDPLPSLPPRISRRCHSLLALASTKTTAAEGASEDADYENLNMPSQPGQPIMAFKARLNVSHSRSRSLRHSGDFTSPFGWIIPPFQQQQNAKTKEQEKRREPIEENRVGEMGSRSKDDNQEFCKLTNSRPVSSRRQQLLHERAHRLELMLNDASVNDCSELYEPSDWSMQAMLSDTVRDMDNLSFMDGPTSQHLSTRNHCQNCCCSSVRRPLPLPVTKCCCQTEYPDHSPSSSSSGSSAGSCHCNRKKKSTGAHKREAIRVRENAATQTELQTSGLAAASRLAIRATAAENPLYMAYSDLTKINCDDLDRSAKKTGTATIAGQGPLVGDDYASDSCETWNSHKALYARLQAAKQSREVTALVVTTPVKKRSKGLRHHINKPLVTPSGSRIWRHDGQSVSTPQKNRRGGARGRHNRRRRCSTANTTANSTSKMDRTAMSTRSTHSSKSSNTLRRCKSLRKPKAADVLHGKGQLQLAIYLNSGLLTIHVQSARYLKNPNSGRLCNSYVKVSLIPDSPEQTFCRTTLVKNDNNPWYDQKFSFEFLSADLYKRLFISVWDRDPKKNRSEFRGCMSFSVSHVIRKDASGWYRLLNGNVGRQRHFAVKKQIDLNNSTIVPTDQDMEEDLVVVDDSDLDTGILNEQDRERSEISSSLSPSSAALPKIIGSDIRHTAARCPSMEIHPKGKTPYTTTVNLKRGPKGYGFSVTWTHPPRIERVEPGLAADLAGMRVADYIVFVGSHNVVKMDEEQVLQLIQSAGDTLTLEIYRKSGNKPSSGCITSDQLTTAELRSDFQQRQPKSPLHEPHRIGRQLHEPQEKEITPLDSLHEIHRVKHGLINAETAMTLAVHRLLSSIQRTDSSSQPIGKASKVVFYLSKLEKMGEEHIDYMIMTQQLRSLNIHTTPLMIASELHKLKKLLDHVTEHLPPVVTTRQKGSTDHDTISHQYYSIFTHLNNIYVFLRTLNQLMKIEDRVDYFLDAFQVSLEKFHVKAQELFCPIECVRLDLPYVGKQHQQQTIIYAATIRQPKLHSNVTDGCLLHQGFLWKRNGSLETRFWALLFTDSLLFTHVNNGVHFVEEEPILLCNMVRLLSAENQLNPSFRLVFRANDKTRIGKVSIQLGRSVVTMRAEDWAQKVTWVDLIRHQMDELQNREHCWNASSLCDKTERVGQQQRGNTNNGSTQGGQRSAIGLLRRVRRCLSTGAIPIPASMAIKRSSLSPTLPPTTTEPTYYQSYSCDDLYLVSDRPPGKFNSSEPISEQERKFTTTDGQQQSDQQTDAVFHDISLSSPTGADKSSNIRIEFINSNVQPVNEQNDHLSSADRLRQRLFNRAIGPASRGKTSRSRAIVKRKNSGGGVGVDPCQTGGEEYEPGRQCVAPEPSSVLHVPHRASDCTQSWTASLCCTFFACKPNQTSEIASATICLENTEKEYNQPNRVRSPKTNTFQAVLGTISEDDGTESCRMRQFQSATNTEERHALHSTGDSAETSPSWASATSSAMETPNGVDQPLAFDFSRKCELNSDGRQQLVLPKCRVAASSRSSSATRAPTCSIPVSYSMPTTPEMSEASPSPRQVSAGFFRFPFVGNASPRRFRSRAMSAESNSEDIGPSVVVGSSSPPSVGYSHHHRSLHEHRDPSLPVQPIQQTDKRLRFPRFLRRTHSASASTEAPPYALFLRTKRMVSKTRSADLTVATGPNEVFSSSVDDAASGAMASRKTRLSEMRLRLGFLRRRSTESALSARPSPEEARKWSESFSTLMASKYGAALYRAFLLREFSNENLEFWLACEEYKNSKPQKLSARAQKIYNDFVAVQATKEVNLDAETRLITLTNVQSNNPDLHAFDRAQRRIQHMMERDSYLRFLQSELFLELVHPERYPASSGDVSDKSSSAP